MSPVPATATPNLPSQPSSSPSCRDAEHALPAAVRAALDGVPTPLLRVDAGGAVWANARAQERWGAGCVALLQEWLANPAVARAVLQPVACQVDMELPAMAPGGRMAHVSSQPDGQGGWTVTLEDAGRMHALQSDVTPDGTRGRVHSQWVVKNGADGLPERAVGLMLDDTETLARGSIEMESQLALAVDLGRIGLWRYDMASERLHCNRPGWDMLDLHPRADGLPLAELQAQTHPADLPGLAAAAQSALQTDVPVDDEARYRRADGGWRTVLTRRVVQRDGSGQPVAYLGVAMDITERAEQARGARELMQRFEAITRTAGIGHWTLDRATGRTEWSEPLRAMYGLAPHDPTPQGDDWINTWVHEDHRERLRETGNTWLRSREQALDLDFRIRRADGQLRHLYALSRRNMVDGRSSVFGVVIDVTERRSAEQALRGASERAALAARSAGLGTWELDLRDGSAHWDDQMWLLRGRPPEPRAMNQEERLACVHPDDRADIAAINRRSSELHLPTETSFRVVWPDGQVRWLASRSQPLYDEQGVAVRQIGVNWDITDARTAEAVRQQRELALRESAAKSQFMSRMSHELRTPLNAVLGFTQLLLADETGSDSQAAARRRRLDHVRAAGHHLLTLINDVLDLASLESGELRIALQPVMLEPVVLSTLPMLAPLLDARGLRIQTQGLEGCVMADATRLRQVLLNLLTNAVKYNRDGGQVTVQTTQDGQQLVLSVADTGVGMDEAQMRQLFEPFNRLGMAAAGIEGSGIGLTIAKSLAERMGGSLTARSTPGQGSVFELRLNLHQTQAAGTDPEAAVQQDVAPPPPIRHDSLRRQLLYIEDNPVNAMIISELLGRRSDLELSVAIDGTRGVELAQALLPQLILLDMQLPDIDGLEVMQRLQADVRTAHIPCIALSANAMPEDIERALQAGVSDYWTKPLDFRAFMTALDTLFGKPS
jgi:PAS domain S-box-containing protein